MRRGRHQVSQQVHKRVYHHPTQLQVHKTQRSTKSKTAAHALLNRRTSSSSLSHADGAAPGRGRFPPKYGRHGSMAGGRLRHLVKLYELADLGSRREMSIADGSNCRQAITRKSVPMDMIHKRY